MRPHRSNVLAAMLLAPACDAAEFVTYLDSIAIVAVGDWNEDGVDDLAVADTLDSRVTIVSGADGSRIATLRGEGRFGAALAALEWPGEEADGLVVGSPDEGRVAVFAPRGREPVSEFRSDRGDLGVSLAAAGDLDDDGYEDFAVSEVLHGEEGLILGGPILGATCRVVSSRTGEVSRSFSSSRAAASFGVRVGTLPDLDGDGASELVLGRPFAPRVQLRRSRDGARIAVLEAPVRGMTSSFDACPVPLSEAEWAIAIGSTDAGRTGAVVWVGPDGEVERTIRGTNAETRFGLDLATVDDVTGDGLSDLVVGAPGDPAFGGLPMMPIVLEDSEAPDSAAGSVTLVAGGSGARVWERSRERPGDLFGIGVTGMGDVDGDGVGEVAALSVDQASRRLTLSVLSGTDGSTVYERALP